MLSLNVLEARICAGAVRAGEGGGLSWLNVFETLERLETFERIRIDGLSFLSWAVAEANPVRPDRRANEASLRTCRLQGREGHGMMQ